jgi:hypothetical protein
MHWTSLIAVTTLLAIAMTSSATVIQGDHQLFIGRTLTFEHERVVEGSWDSEMCGRNGMDLFLGYDDGCCLVLSCCCGLRIGSSLSPVYFSLVPYDSSNLDVALPLADTSRFRRIDSMNTTISCNSLPGIIVRSSIGQGDSALLDSLRHHFFVIETGLGLYAMLRIEEYIIDYRPGLSSCISGVQLKWRLQTDGGTNFAVPNTANRPGTLHVMHRIPPTSSDGVYFSVSGRTLSYEKLHQAYTGVVILHERSGHRGSKVLRIPSF